MGAANQLVAIGKLMNILPCKLDFNIFE